MRLSKSLKQVLIWDNWFFYAELKAVARFDFNQLQHQLASDRLRQMNAMRKNTRLTCVFLALFLGQVFAPATMASQAKESHQGGIVICTTTGLKLLTSQGTLIPVGEQNQSLAFEHCQACFTSVFLGNVDKNVSGLHRLSRTLLAKKTPLLSQTSPSFWTILAFGARAPPV